MYAFTTDVSATPATRSAAIDARSFLGSFLLNSRVSRAPVATTAAPAYDDVSSATVPKLASGMGFMAWRS